MFIRLFLISFELNFFDSILLFLLLNANAIGKVNQVTLIYKFSVAIFVYLGVQILKIHNQSLKLEIKSATF